MNHASEIKIGVCSWSFWQDIQEQLEFLASNGFTSTSLLQHAMKLEESEKKEIAASIKEKNLTLTWHSNVLKEHLINDQIDQNYMKRLYDEVIWWHENTNGVYSSCSDANLRHVCIEHLAYMRDRLSKHGIRFGLENTCFHNEGKYFCYPSQMKEINDTLQPPDPLCGVLLDSGHANVCCTKYGLDMDSYIAKIPGEIWEVHISDNHGESDEHLPLGDGTLDLERFFRALKKKNFHGVVTLESLRARDRNAFDIHVPIDVDSLLKYKEDIESVWKKVSV